MVRNSIILPKFPVPNVEHPYGYVYLTTNLINGMLYVGQHKATQFNSRYYGGGSYFCRALSAYGSKNFWYDEKQASIVSHTRTKFLPV